MTQVRRTQLGRSTGTRDLRREPDADATAFVHGGGSAAGNRGARRRAPVPRAAQRSRPTATHSISTRALFGRPDAAMVDGDTAEGINAFLERRPPNFTWTTRR